MLCHLKWVLSIRSSLGYLSKSLFFFLIWGFFTWVCCICIISTPSSSCLPLSPSFEFMIPSIFLPVTNTHKNIDIQPTGPVSAVPSHVLRAYQVGLWSHPWKSKQTKPGKWFSLCQWPLAIAPKLRAGPCEIFLHPGWHISWCIHRSYAGSHSVRVHRSNIPVLFKRNYLVAVILVLGSSPSSVMLPELRCGSWVIDVPLKAEHPLVTYSLHFDQV